MSAQLHADRLAALQDEPLDWRFKGLPASWWGRTTAQVRSLGPAFFDDGPSGPVCVLRESALVHNLTTMANWCAERGVELAPHGKTHMAPQLLARQFQAGACAVTAATISQVRVFRAFGVTDVVLANEVVDLAGLAWLAAELDGDPDFHAQCWVDSVAGVELMTAGLAGAQRRLDVCVEVGMPGGRTGCRTDTEVDEVARAAASSPRLRLVGLAGYEASTGQDVGPEAVAGVRAYLRGLRAATVRLAGLFEADTAIVTAGGSTYPDVVADELAGDWPAHMSVRTILRSGCYLTHDDGLYARTSPLRLRPAMQVWAQVVSRPEPDLALVTMGRRDVSFDAGLPVPLSLPGSSVVKLNDQHAFLRLADGDQAPVGSWLPFGISHPCTTFDKWQLIPVLDEDDRVTDLVRTFF
ncbi:MULTISPECIES: alanine racemase [unclassified Mycolicibacterium]|uniref:alanine racemase n=1 Tax=unclassified Mycolicibacterium TaxID=2636767 RepID=UPI0012DBCD91|nr:MULTISPECIES: alanine racemase [unclassified Mycolicibacterium]MUL84115.1 amino acid deaminase [Mycolicibacterium sp. CBMA 329]MUL89819.1 amino acid deaminase [Mycolicibacterium sp. CBMA 331]MUL99993.1 amino acid deaminase [Mycolicibacterium sp. CBMA 334]MUM28079.1 amino acid deaminase [Mycolicibacterium sp. CBMA 295]MUM39334.1 amino acid deaminase [Mycolicibacterium sp. CBMA 247]